MILLKRGFVLTVIFLVLIFFGCSSGGQSSLQPSVTEPLTQNPSANATPSASGGVAVVPTTVPDNTVPSDSASVTTTETPTPSPEDTALHHSPYKLGDTGDDVKQLQSMLIALGFDPGDADGSYGTQLEKAIRNFQLYVDLMADGIAGQKTVDALLERYGESMTVSRQSEQPLKGCVIGIDPGHQRNDNSGLEPVKPDSSDMKKMVSSGTAGRFTGVPEYVINLQVGLKLKSALEALGAKVVITRETHGVNITNAERAKMMNKSGVDCWLRVHANGSDDSAVHGMFILVPSKGSMATDDMNVQEKSVKLAETLLKATVETTGAKDLGVTARNDQTGFGWSKVPVCNIEMGHMTNQDEDFLLVSESYQMKIVKGLVNGFIAYFK
jgi:N-acetylmuramoyl-L-alanine amidase